MFKETHPILGTRSIQRAIPSLDGGAWHTLATQPGAMAVATCRPGSR
jgi:hypothetical protein